MPKIDAPTVAEHRARMQARLVDAAEEILRAGPSTPLTAGAVSEAAGIARNSIYRYVDTVDDLRPLVVERYLPDWLAAVDAAVAAAPDAEGRVVAWVDANLVQAGISGHGWLIAAARRTPAVGAATAAGGPADGEAVDRAHTGLWASLSDAWREVLGPDEDRVAVAAGLTRALADAGFAQLDAGRPVGLVREMGTGAARALVERWGAAGS